MVKFALYKYIRLDMEQKRTKIVATIADNRCEVEFLRSLYKAGMNVVRINSAHLTPDAASVIVKNVREVSDKIAILIDTKGPEIRTTKCVDDGFEVESGDEIIIKGGTNELSSKETLYVSYLNIVKVLEVGTSILIDDGDIKMVVVDKRVDGLVARVSNSGKIKNRKSVNIPGVSLSMESVTKRDREFIEWAIKEDIDFIAHSFVRKREDVMAVQEILNTHKSSIKIISKIENMEGVDNIDEILECTYGVMIARGDLGVEIPAERIPYIQRDIIRRCYESKRPVIVATQMLQSMITSPRPTRAEVSDIASAIFQRTDAIMLSGETANGDYPLEAGDIMSRVAIEIESSMDAIHDVNLTCINNPVTAELSRATVMSCDNLPIKAIIIDTLSGRTGRYLAAFRGSRPVYAMCYNNRVMRELALSYGIYPSYHETTHVHRSFLVKEVTELLDNKIINENDMIAVVGGDYGAKYGPSFMDITHVKILMEKFNIETSKK